MVQENILEPLIYFLKEIVPNLTLVSTPQIAQCDLGIFLSKNRLSSLSLTRSLKV
jgi:hypothetical protein